jgi:hypothetical protein
LQSEGGYESHSTEDRSIAGKEKTWPGIQHHGKKAARMV